MKRLAPVAHRLIFVGAICIAAGLAQPGHAVTFGFGCITFNDPGDCSIGESQLLLDVEDGGGGLVDFTFRNEGPEQSSIARVYFEDLTPLFETPIFAIEERSGVSFSQDATPSELPGGNNVGFMTTRVLSASAAPPPAGNGVNPGEWLNTVLELMFGFTFADVIGALNVGITQGHVEGESLRVATHVIDFESGGSESLIAVPVPTSLALFLTGLLGFAFLARRRRQRAEA